MLQCCNYKVHYPLDITIQMSPIHDLHKIIDSPLPFSMFRFASIIPKHLVSGAARYISKIRKVPTVFSTSITIYMYMILK